MRRIILLFTALIFISTYSFANEQPVSEEDSSFDITAMIMEHIGDSHEYHIITIPRKEKDDLHLTISLPVVLWHEGKLHVFNSSNLYHQNVVNRGDVNFKLVNEKIFITDFDGTLFYDEAGDITNEKPLDLSITKNVFTMFLVMAILLYLGISAGQTYKKTKTHEAPKGVQRILEPVVLFVRDNIVRVQIQKDKADFFMPFLLTLFLFIWVSNLLGVIPFFPGGANLSGNIAYTMTLAIFAFLATNIFGSKHYWKDILTAPGAPFYVKVFLVPIEIIGMFTKPFALMLRLFANITAGHIIILSLTSVIFVLGSLYASPLSILLSLIMFALELLVATLQAYIFTLLTALFIGMAVKTEH